MKGIIFNKYGLEDEVITGKKTITKRPIIIPDKIKGITVCGYTKYSNAFGMWNLVLTDEDDSQIEGGSVIQPYEIGDMVAIKQSYNNIDYNFLKKFMNDDEIFKSKGYRNKMFVNPVFMPHHIMITNIYPAYVQNITDEEALAAGIIKWDKYGDEKNYTYIAPNVGYWRGFGWNDYKTPQEAYGALINKIYGQNVWENNEMWWTIEFETID